MTNQKRARKQEVIDRNKFNLERLEQCYSKGIMPSKQYTYLRKRYIQAIKEASIGM